MTTIKILGRDINVVMVPVNDLEKMADVEQCLGMFKDDTIYLSAHLTGDLKERVLKHEKMHAMLSISGITNLLEKKLEETICDLMENW